jgi:tRNA (guanine-N7-)-methyltransferase
MIDIDLDQVSIPLQWPELFGRDAPTDIEIGTGKGKFLNEFATAQPERNILGVERSAKYHSLCCDRAARRGLTNVRVLRTTGEDLLFRLLTEASVANMYVLFPDPWPKKRHHKRRIFKSEIVVEMVRALAIGGRLLVKSDHADYAEVIGEALAGAPGLTPINTDSSTSTRSRAVRSMPSPSKRPSDRNVQTFNVLTFNV